MLRFGAMLFFLICLLAAGCEVSAGGRKPPPGCPFPSGPYAPPDCGPNAYFEVCSYPCPPQNCSVLWTRYRCKEECCKPECRCKDGYLRDDKTGMCIDRDECFAPCGPFERFVRGSTKCQKTCANYKVNAPDCMCKPFTGCVCKSGRVRVNDDATGACVLPEQCPSRRCPLHEHLDKCPSVCVNETCISKSPDFKCLLPAIPLPCKPRCICDKGYLRNHLGFCVPENRCPVKSCPINEVWRCASTCAHDSCKRLEPGFKCPPGVESVCIPACVCKDGYLRNDRGLCIARELCPASLRCGINEVAVECATVSPPQTCESVYSIYPIVDVPCSPGCDCRPGYLRNKRNICIPSDFCPAVPPNQCGPNQEYRHCGSACDPSCADLDNPSTQLCCNECVAGCFCKPGYLKDGQGFCIPRDECPLPVCNKPNEVAKACGSACEQRTCEDYKRTDIGCAAVCVRGCFCREGYVRNAYGVCVPPEQCPPEPVCLLDNEEYLSCGSSCPDTCDNYRDTGRICTANCVAGCFCERGYVRDLQTKACVKPEQCPTEECTGLNEEWHSCASYCPVTCANRFTLGDWACITLCREACDCVPGTLRADNGTCVPAHECTPPVCRENEKYMKCGTACPLTCDNYKNPPTRCTHQCVEDCFCKDGYVRDRNMRCVKPENCEPICPAGEKYDICSAHCQDTCENYNVTNRSCTYQCQSGCVCDAGTVRRKDGQCVPPSECKPTCPAGEKYSACSAHCQDTCENHNVTNRTCTHQCQPGCVCGAGTVRRKDGHCVPPSECCNPTCPVDEVYDRCTAHCEPTCKYPDGQPCAKICKSGCRCRKGLVRRDDGRCVAANECDRICPVGEKYDKCYAHCQDTCENYNVTNRPCTHQCQPGCVCEAGTVRRKDGHCVPPSECCNPTCPVDEVYDRCSAHCEPTCKYPDGQPCTKICKSGCRCRKGLVRRYDGRCVAANECGHTAVTPPPPRNFAYHAAAVELAIGADIYYAHCQHTCENYNVTNRTCTHQCQPGCVCGAGTVRRKDGHCVPPSKCCNPTCPVDEVYDRCTAHCEPTCKYPDGQPCTKICKSGCRCRKGLVRRDDGRCVAANECDQICPVGEKYDKCYAHCQDTCENYNVTNRPCTHQCQPGCVCNAGTVRRKDGHCVPPSECCNPTCPVDEVYDRCTAHCEPTCKYPDGQPCAKICKSGCRCRKGLVRRDDGRCVAANECDQICPVGEKYDKCYAHCQDTCENYNVTNRPCTHQCQPGCVCNAGTVRRKDGHCVPPSECCNPTCPVDEVYDRCTAHCEPTCKYPDGQPCTKICKSGCRCRKGLVRRDDGRCVAANECDQICPVGEKYDKCYAHCQDTCENYNVTNRPCTHQCQPGCVCNAGTVRRKDGHCVPPSECCNPTCPVDEVYDRCTAHCEPTCKYPDGQPCTKICKSGCRCRKGLVRRDDGRCVAANECDQICPVGEKYDKCYAHCQDTCENYNVTNRPCTHQCQPGCVCNAGTVRRKDGHCVPPSVCCNPTCPVDEVYDRCTAHCEPTCKYPDGQPCTKICKSGCRCRKGLVRRDDGRCVVANECDQICPVGEKYDKCYAHCQDTCENYNVTNRPCTHQCQPGCVCNAGTVRRKDGHCVPPSECCNPTCPVDEVYDRCTAHCEPTCKYPDGQPCTKICKSGCRCRKGLVRRDDGRCVAANECDQICPVGEKYDKCYAHCQDTCENYNVTNRPCTHQCQPGCVCNAGTVRRKDGHCVPPSECCNPTCPVDEVYDRCTAHCEPTCKYPDGQPCAKICKSGCRCRKGLVRRDDGRCVAANECDQICPVGEKYDKCYAHCQDTCENYNVTNRPCTHQCQPGCVCNAGTVRRKDGHCVPPSECCNPTCPVDEVYDRCTAHCEPTCKYPDGQPCAKICKSGCRCRKGLVRRDDGRCVAANECDQICPVGEKYDKCYAHCQDTCENYNVTNRPCTHQCQPGCVCNAGTVRRKDGHCVPPSECCNPTCPVDEVYDRCTAHCEPTCKYPDGQPCTKICKSGCRCRKGLVRRDDGRCVAANECGNPTCPVDEVYDRCTAHCEPTCKYPDGQPCAKICKSGCRCRKGLVRRDDGRCVAANECDQICPVGEKYDKCNAHCQDTCENYNVTNRPCTHQCQPGCVCDAGTVRRKDGHCVPPSECCNPTCPLDEVYDHCTAHCEPTCKYPDGQPCAKICKSGCRCRKGLVRRDDGRCVAANECDQICPVREKYDKCYAHCQDTCENYNVTNRPCTHQCQPGCVCDAGTVRRKDGHCVPPSECCNPTCPVDEVYDRCTAHCEPTCKYPDRQPCAKICKSGCRCRKGLVRRDDGRCVAANECDQICPVGEKYDKCHAHCQDTCENYNVTNRPCTHQCQPGCVCDAGTVRRKDGHCVPPSECCNPTCPVDEVYDRCTAHCEPTCKYPDGQPCTKICKSGCRCRKGLVRRNDGRCVAANECDQICPVGEKYDKCYAHCQDTCENYNVTNRPCTHQCQPGCVCNAGTVRRKDGHCVPPSECCNPTCPVDEVYDRCTAHCEPTCKYPDGQPCTKICKSGCRCRKGLVRRDDGRCVAANECGNPTCPVDEVYDRCTAHCEPTCKYPDGQPCAKICKSGCRCRKGLVRRDDGRCVAANECDQICPVGEKYDKCYAHCQDTCENYNVTNRPCTHQCQPGCVCDAGTVRRKDGHCVPPSECCNPTCPVDEVYDRCTAHCEPTCKYPDGQPCAKICKAGCRCRKGLVRRDDGRCVAANECVKPIICPPNEVLSDCYNTCHKTCKTRLRSDGRVCHLACIESGCLCIDGYLRHDNGTCVPINQCSPPRCHANETYAACGSACAPTCASRGDTCHKCTEQCVEDCFCSTGYVRADDGTCVDPTDCPPRTCSDPNEEFVECPPTCPPGDKCSNMWTKYDCSKFPDCCKPQCRCKPNYARNKKGKCIPSKQCMHEE